MEGTVRRMPEGRRPFKPRTALLRLEADRGFGTISDTLRSRDLLAEWI